jgi:hypothetical protein
LRARTRQVSAAPFSLAATQGMLLLTQRDFLFLRLLRCFTSPGSPPSSKGQIIRHDSYGVPPFGNLRIKACLPAPRSLSQAATSFFAIWYQGIHRVLLWFNHKNEYSFFSNRITLRAINNVRHWQSQMPDVIAPSGSSLASFLLHRIVIRLSRYSLRDFVSHQCSSSSLRLISKCSKR